MVVMAPADERECRALLTTAFMLNQPSAVRYPRGAGVGMTPDTTLEPLPLAKAEIRREGNQNIAILAFGTLLYPALEAAEKIDATVVNMRFVKPLDEALLLKIAETHQALVTIEEGVIAGGAGSACLEVLARHNICKPVLQLGLPDQFIDHGDHSQLLSLWGLDAKGIQAAIYERFATLVTMLPC
jgi:1-deoxy-D-xylulose-5-phosphate synthase